MPVQITRLRRWFAIGAIAMSVIVLGAYYYAKWRVENALKEVPRKIGVEVQQSAEGFTISKSEGGRTIFKVQAGKAVQYRQSGHAELRDVNITLYGEDSSRFDQIYGESFEYDPVSGDISAKGDVQIDLEANPEGVLHPDQTLPKALKNPIHLKTRGLVFNHKSGHAYTKEKIEFRIPQAYGSATGATYSSQSNALTLESQVNIEFSGENPATLMASRAILTREPRLVVLERPRALSRSQSFEAPEAKLFLRRDNTLDRVLASGGIRAESKQHQSAKLRAGQLDLLMAEQRSGLRQAIFSGDVQVEGSGSQAMRGRARRVEMDFAPRNVITTARAEGDVLVAQHSVASSGGSQDVELSAPAATFTVAGGRRLARAETSGAAQMAIRSGAGEQTRVTAGRFEAKFNSDGRLASLHGAPDARIVSTAAGRPDRVSSSRMLEATFRSDGGVESIEQEGTVTYADGSLKTWGEQVKYTASDQMLALSGSPRVIEGGLTITAGSMRLNRATGEASAGGDVKSSYSDLKAQPDGALLASSGPIHVTAQAMTARRSPPTATYTGGARLWQGANVIEAPSIEFNRERRSLVARGSASRGVSTILVQADSKGAVTPVTITSSQLDYDDSQRKAHFEGAVTVKGADVTVQAEQMDVFLAAQVQRGASSPSKLERIVARGSVLITQPERRATGEQLSYIAGEDKFVLSGGSPSIFDAEHGKITGVSLTFFRRDDRVLVEGNSANPVVTQTRVAR